MTGTVLTSHQYAWSNNVGYINFKNVIVGESALSGYAWSESKGFIKFNPARGGVMNDGSGNLSGSAWGEQLGWIDFSGVSINSDGLFTGTATGTLVGTINFGCPTYCDVQTDWRVTVNPGGGHVLGAQTIGIPAQVEVVDQPLILEPDQAGVLTVDTPAEPVIITIPANTSGSQITIIIEHEPLTPSSEGLVPTDKVLINGEFYNIYARDSAGNIVDSFSPPLTITLPIDQNLLGLKDLGVYYYVEANREWALIPDAVFTSSKVTFQVGHLTKFAIFGGLAVEQKPPSLPIEPVPGSTPVVSPHIATPTVQPEAAKPIAPQVVPVAPQGAKIQGKVIVGLAAFVSFLLLIILLAFRFSRSFWIRKH